MNLSSPQLSSTCTDSLDIPWRPQPCLSLASAPSFTDFAPNLPLASPHRTSPQVGGYLWVSFRGDEGYSGAIHKHFQNKVYVHLARRHVSETYGQGTEMWAKLGQGEAYTLPSVAGPLSGKTVYVCSIGAHSSAVVVTDGDATAAVGQCSQPRPSPPPPLPPFAPPPPSSPPPGEGLEDSKYVAYYGVWKGADTSSRYSGGRACFTKCDEDPTCLGVQILANYRSQCYKISSTPEGLGEGMSMDDAKAKGSAWSVFMKNARYVAPSPSPPPNSPPPPPPPSPGVGLEDSKCNRAGTQTQRAGLVPGSVLPPCSLRAPSCR